ncbi:alpha-amylase family glycosyl hydrolase [Clostridium swellfunianum]|uniref:alpha-amylase family glycosyl hydrolase n=1 Tax=Clostridium swellfunianum TaxID=1367462 RepID=UPI002030255D|nr:alpha-amylase family glycosyl hydrolase [Clostridium swellfunianum]MCM0646830.1 alpha-amylase family glycosyl hydrolase [Clostridium swellfunianum]
MKKRFLSLSLVVVLISTLFFGCKRQTIAQGDLNQKQVYNGRVFYEIFVRAFNDSNGDGKGDLKGVTQKLDYLSKDLGVSGIWLMPINVSPSYHGYDVTDYYNVNSDYGTIEDLKNLLNEAHKRNIKVVMDLVMNHTSKEHPWFKEAASDKNNKHRNYYVWADKNTDVTEGSAISPQPWVPSGQEHYYALFWEGMPDLNFDNKEVRDEMKKVAKFYLDLGIDGFRLDAAMHIYNETDKNIQWWKEFSNFVKSENKDVVLVGEVWDKTPTIAQYMNTLDSAFNFPAGEAIVNMVSSGSVGNADFTIVNSFEQYAKQNLNFIDSPFLTNHDQNRVMSILNDVEKAKKAASILLTLPGTPYIYYGEETGMTGVKPDERIREPFIWDAKDTSENTSWIDSTNESEKVAVSVQLKDKNSLINHYKNVIAIRNNNDVIKYGNFELVETNSSNVFAFKRTLDNKSVYVYVNLGSESLKEKIDINKAKVLFSNKITSKNLNFKGEVELKGDDTLILEAK